MKLVTPLGAHGPSGLATIVDEEAQEEIASWPPTEPASNNPISNSTNNLESKEQKEPNKLGTTGESKAHPERQHRRHRSVPVLSASIDRAKQAIKRRSIGEADHERLYFSEISSNSNKKEENQQATEAIMDRRRAAMGPRPPSNVIGGEHSDDQRTQAFESIFGRPSAAHRDTQPHAQQRPQQPINPSLYYPQQYQQQPPQQRHLQPMAHQQQQYQRSIRPTEQPYGYPYGYSRSNYTPSSIASTGVIASPPPPASDPSLEAFTNRGLTPAQAYQAKVFAEGSGGVPPGSYQPAQTTSYDDPLSLPPRLDSLTLSDDGGRLSLDFNHQSPPKSNGSMTRPTQQTFANFDDEPEGDSELPWVNAGQRTRA